MELTADLGWLLLIGFVAQLVDGSIGMGYGLIGSSFLATLGFPPAMASATVHAAEVVTTGVSGLSHAWFRNLDRRLFTSLLLPGVAGGIAGALLLTRIPGDSLRPFVWGYLFLLACLLLARVLRGTLPLKIIAPGPSLGVSAGFLDAVGGGGWGTITTSTLVSRGMPPRYAVGTANAVEFFVTSAITVTLWLGLGGFQWDAVLALIAGGAAAAPLAAWTTRHMPQRPASVLVGMAVLALSVTGLFRSLSPG